VHLAFNAMVGVGFVLLALGIWLGWAWKRSRAIPKSRLFLLGVSISGVAAVVALECGWITTEVGRQPWIVYNVMRVAEAANPVQGIQYGFYALLLVYGLLTAILVIVLRHLARLPLKFEAFPEPTPQTVRKHS
jgi:cytochrome bd ubiquinol oxidase subunit I